MIGQKSRVGVVCALFNVTSPSPRDGCISYIDNTPPYSHNMDIVQPSDTISTPLPLENTLSLKAASSPILLDTLFLLFLRLVFFLLSRKFLLSTLNPTLRDLSKPETLLPPTSLPDNRPRTGSVGTSTGTNVNHGHGRSGLPVSDPELELDTEDDGLLSNTSPISSYPPSPAYQKSPLPTTSPTPRDPFGRRNTDDVAIGVGSSGSGAGGSGGNGQGMEMHVLGQKLKEASIGVGKRIDVLQLSHGKSSGSVDNAGTKGLKRATRGLNRASR
jgi:hypothetical protein